MAFTIPLYRSHLSTWKERLHLMTELEISISFCLGHSLRNDIELETSPVAWASMACLLPPPLLDFVFIDGWSEEEAAPKEAALLEEKVTNREASSSPSKQ
eukprot:c36505_g1_i1 orf=3-299(-)